MSQFVKFSAKGYIFERDENGRVIKFKGTRYGSGVVQSSNEIMGKIFRQCPELLPCDRLDIQTFSL